MIVDLSYIKNVLEVDVEDSQLQYLLHHYFDDICQKINVITTLIEQEISDIAMASTDSENSDEMIKERISMIKVLISA